MKRGSSSSSSSFGSGKRAAGPSSAAAAEEDRRAAFLGALAALNAQFAAWVQAAVAKDPDAPLIDAGHDYIAYVTALEEKYLRPDGEVFTFGSGECGQLAHGVEEEDDLSVRKPRIVTSLRDKHVRVVACGGIHSVAVGADGRVWSWGCNDDGALGRATGPYDPEDLAKGFKGDENFPALVTLGPSGGGGGRGLGGAANLQVVHVACGDSQTVALTVGGDVWGWGSYKDKEGRKWFDLPEGYTGKVGVSLSRAPNSVALRRSKVAVK
jgi:regulator of chromosome condensation